MDIITDGMPAPVKEMKALLGAVAAWILMIGAPLVYAETAFQSGYRHGWMTENLILLSTAQMQRRVVLIPLTKPTYTSQEMDLTITQPHSLNRCK